MNDVLSANHNWTWCILVSAASWKEIWEVFEKEQNTVINGSIDNAFREIPNND
jgi:hypothetical protein